MRRNSITAGLLVLVLVSAGMGFRPENTPTFILPKTTSVHSGDILLLEGTSFRGWVVRLLNDKSDFSHAGIIEITNGDIYLLHADPKKGCVRERLSDLLTRQQFTSAAVLRPKGPSEVSPIVQFCRNAIARHTPFNGSFRYLHNTGYYCTEFVLKAYEATGMTLLKNISAGDIVFPEQLLGSPVLSRIP